MLADETDDSTQSFLPRSAESKEALAIIEEEFPGGDAENALVVYRREGGLTDADRSADQGGCGGAERGLESSRHRADEAGADGGEKFKRRRSVAFTTALFKGGDQEKLADEGEAAAGGAWRPRRRPRGLPLRLARLLQRFGRGLRGARHDAADRDRDARPDPAPADLPGAVDRDPAAPRRRLLLHGRDRDRLLHGQGRPPRRFPGHLDPRGPDVRRGHGLLPADRLALPRGVTPPGGQASGDGARHPPRRPGGARERPDRRRARCW